MENCYAEWRPPGMELLHPLMHDCGWAYDDCRPQSSIPEQMQTKPSEIFTIKGRYHFCGYGDFHKNTTCPELYAGKSGAGKLNSIK